MSESQAAQDTRWWGLASCMLLWSTWPTAGTFRESLEGRACVELLSYPEVCPLKCQVMLSSGQASASSLLALEIPCGLELAQLERGRLGRDVSLLL